MSWCFLGYGGESNSHNDSASLLVEITNPEVKIGARVLEGGCRKYAWEIGKDKTYYVGYRCVCVFEREIGRESVFLCVHVCECAHLFCIFIRSFRF